MIKTRSEQLKKVMENNRDWALILEGAREEEIGEGLRIDARISEEELNRGGYKEKIKEAEKIIIANMDKVGYNEQEKFMSLLKDRRLNGQKLPEKVQVIIPVGYGADIAPTLDRVCLRWKVI